jgi:hypothetical protein
LIVRYAAVENLLRIQCVGPMECIGRAQVEIVTPSSY